MRQNARTGGVDDAAEGWFVRVAGRVGDLGSPFYDDERQRDLWNEANAVGFQVLLWLLPAAAVVSVWTGGEAAVPYGFAMFLASGLASWVVLAFAGARGLDLRSVEGVSVLRWRLVAYLLLLAAFSVGVLRAVPEDGFAHGAGTGLVIGGVVGIAVVGWTQLRAGRAGAEDVDRDG